MTQPKFKRLKEMGKERQIQNERKKKNEINEKYLKINIETPSKAGSGIMIHSTYLSRCCSLIQSYCSVRLALLHNSKFNIMEKKERKKN